jgi:hypothetical protein
VSIGPVEYVIISFPENRFDGRIAPALDALAESGIVRIIDIVFITKDDEGNAITLEFEDLEGADAIFAELPGEAGGLLNEGDIERAAEELAPGSSGLLILWEDVWAKPLADALADAGGVLVGGGRIPRDLVQAAFDYIESAG